MRITSLVAVFFFVEVKAVA